ncbi:MAG: tRNA 2-thiouridine(34) synthase MnmA [Bdellovibrionales bacterium]|nr:tRNA 2-thiouridine(34) synthase MnmA [Bdellovibrionales bacterium]
MSGGVDSSVAAYLLKEQGFDVLGLFMKNWDETDENGNCSANEDYKDVQKVCAELGIPCYSIEFVEEYRDHVFSEFLKQYEAGFTPNPDVLCNREIKFDLFLKKAEEFGCDYLATGHYCQVAHDTIAGDSKGPLRRAIDANKDQTYFLTAVPGKIFQKVLFPIGHLTKPEVREIAKKIGLATHAKKDSTGICFIGERKFKTFLNQYVQAKPGDIRELESGEVVGRHDGIAFHTLGQRKGLGLGGEGEPWFVVAKDKAHNELVVARGVEHPALYSRYLFAQELNWMASLAPTASFDCTAKTRYRQVDQPCAVSFESDGRVRVDFKDPQRAVTPGQYVVFYQDDACLGGGVISEVGPSLYEEKSTKTSASAHPELRA